MDAQYPFASRDDIWRVFEELKELRVGQFEQSERLGRLERRRDEDARMRNVWGSGPLSPYPTAVGASLSTETAFSSPPDAFKGFDQGQHHGMNSSSVGLDGEDEPRRGTSRANSVRFDESAIHGYYGQAGRSSTDLPLRTGSGLGSHPLTERSLSHRSDGRQSSSGQSHHSARTNSLGLDTSRLMGSSSFGGSPLTTPPAGLFLLGPVPCIIRCWLTTNFSNESLLYAAVCSGSYVSSVGESLVHKLGLETEVTQEDGHSYIKLPFYLPEASVHQSSSRPSSPQPHLPSLAIRFLIRQTCAADDSIQVILGSDVLRSHNADILFSQDKMTLVDDDRNRLSVPLVRPERDSVFKSLWTVSDASHMEPTDHINGHEPVGVIGQSTHQQSSSAPASARASIGEAHKPILQTHGDSISDAGIQSTPTTASDTSSIPGNKSEPVGAWGSWRRDSKPDPHRQDKEKRPMKVLRPAKASSRVNSSTSTPTALTAEHTDSLAISGLENTRPAGQAAPRSTSDGSNKQRSSNPVGGASAFGWLNSNAPGSGTQTSSQIK